MPRRSERIAKGAGGTDPGDSSDEGDNRRASIGDALGLQTPNRLKGANLREAKANEAAEAAARRLDSMRQPLRVRKGTTKKKMKNRKSRQARKRDRRSAIALLKQTADLFNTPVVAKAATGVTEEGDGSTSAPPLVSVSSRDSSSIDPTTDAKDEDSTSAEEDPQPAAEKAAGSEAEHAFSLPPPQCRFPRAKANPVPSYRTHL